MTLGRSLREAAEYVLQEPSSHKYLNLSLQGARANPRHAKTTELKETIPWLNPRQGRSQSLQPHLAESGEGAAER